MTTPPPNPEMSYGTPAPGYPAYQTAPPAKKRSTLKIVLTVLGVLALLFVLLIGGIVYFVFAALKHSEATTIAVRTAEGDPGVQEALGTPLVVGTLVSGSNNTNSGSGSAHLEIPVTGPKGAGTIYTDEVLLGGAWKVTMLEVRPKSAGAATIKVIEDGRTQGTPEGPPADTPKSDTAQP